MSNTFLKVHVDAGLATVTLNRPEAHNSLSVEVLRELLGIFARFSEDETVLGILLTGEGKSFCAGADISAMQPMTTKDAAAFADLGQRVMSAIENVGKPVIAAVNGYALGGGLELALACDFIVAAESAQFAAPGPAWDHSRFRRNSASATACGEIQGQGDDIQRQQGTGVRSPCYWTC